jgi:hypothetical protein
MGAAVVMGAGTSAVEREARRRRRAAGAAVAAVAVEMAVYDQQEV